jgi:hypothetical protein
MPIELIVRRGMDSAFLAWRAPFIKGCRGFTLTRRVKRTRLIARQAPQKTGQQNGFTIEALSSWVGFANGPKVDPGTRKPTREWPIQEIRVVGFDGQPRRPSRLSIWCSAIAA